MAKNGLSAFLSNESEGRNGAHLPLNGDNAIPCRAAQKRSKGECAPLDNFVRKGAAACGRTRSGFPPPCTFRSPARSRLPPPIQSAQPALKRPGRIFAAIWALKIFDFTPASLRTLRKSGRKIRSEPLPFSPSSGAHVYKKFCLEIFKFGLTCGENMAMIKAGAKMPRRLTFTDSGGGRAWTTAEDVCRLMAYLEASLRRFAADRYAFILHTTSERHMGAVEFCANARRRPGFCALRRANEIGRRMKSHGF